MKRFAFLLLILSTSIATQGQALVEGSPDAREPETPLIYFSVYLWTSGGMVNAGDASGTISNLYYDTPQGLRGHIPVFNGRSSPLYPYQGPQTLTLFDIKKRWVDPPAEAPPGTQPTLEWVRIPLVKAQIPEGMKRAMIIVFPGKRNSDGLTQVAVVSYGSEALKPGMSRIINGTKRDVAIRFGNDPENTIRLGASGYVELTNREFSDKKFKRLFIYGMNEQNQVSLLHTNRLFFNEDKTNLFLVVPDGDKRVRIQKIGSHKAPPKSDPATTDL